MYISELKLVNFRNHKKNVFIFEKGMNLILGNNGVGKTNIVEAIFMCAITKSIKTNLNKEIINFDAKNAYVSCTILPDKKEIEIIIGRTKKISINGKKTNTYNEVIGNLYAVYFSPQEMNIIDGAPSDRRRLVDIHISQLDSKYLKYLSDYTKIIEKRNKYLKSLFKNNIKDYSEILPWDMQLTKPIGYIIEKRKELIDRLLQDIKDVHLNISKTANIDIKYQQSIDENAIAKKLRDNFERDYICGYTTSGIHKDDFVISLNNKELKKFGSQGQKKTAIIAIKYGQAMDIKKTTGRSPIILLDDVFSELDKGRRENILSLSLNYQTIITGTDLKEEIDCRTINL